MNEKIIEWLQKTGYPLELFGESILSEQDFKIVNSYIYLDLEKKISRELDLFGSFESKKDGVILTLNLLVECKKSDKPIILLTNNNSKEKFIKFSQYLNVDSPNVRTIINNDVPIKLPGRCSFGFKIIQAFTDGDEFINKAANTLIKSEHEFKLNNLELLEMAIESNWHNLAIPVLLIDAPLLELVTNENSEIQLNEIDSCILEYRNLIPELHENFSIPIIQKKNFREFVENFKLSSKHIIDFLVKNPKQQMNKYHMTEITLRIIK